MPGLTMVKALQVAQSRVRLPSCEGLSVRHPHSVDLHRLTLHQLGFYAVVKHHDKGSCCQERFALGLQLPRDKSYHYDCRWRRTRVWVIGTTMTSHLKLQVGNRVNWSWWETFNSKVLPQWCTSSKTAPPKPSQTIQPTEYHIFKH